MTIKQRFLDAIVNGELGSRKEAGMIITLLEFKTYFSDINTQYVNSFLPAAVIEAGQRSVTHTKFLFRLRKGVYLVHEDAIETHIIMSKINTSTIKEHSLSYFI